MSKLLGKVAIVTGASRGIGRAIALELAKEGASIVVNYSRDEDGAKETEKQLREIGTSVLLCKEDISNFKSCKNIVDKTIETFGKVDILVNNAAKSTIGLFMDNSEEDINTLLNTNLLGPLYLSRNVIGHMINRGGVILNISSIWGEVGASCEVLYSTSKGGINLFTKSLAKEMAGCNIRVNAIAPGVIDTDMNKFLSKEDRKDLEDEIPMGRFGLPKEIAKTAVFLCSKEASYITGQVIKVDGGMI